MTIKKFAPIKITDNFFQLGTTFFPMYLSIGEDAMLLEGGTGGTTGIIIEQIQELGIEPARIKYLALTHSHGDHIGSVTALRKKWPHLKLIANPTASKILGYEKVVEEFLKLDDFIIKRMKVLEEIKEIPEKIQAHNFHVDTVVEEGSSIDLGSGIKWDIYFTPGHSTCQVAFHEKKDAIMVTGDASGLYNPEMHAFWPNYFISLEQYCNSLRKLMTFHTKRYALSHYGVIESENGNFLKDAMAATEDYHLEMIERVNNGEDPAEIALEKARWIESFVVHMPFKIMEQMSLLLINRSQKDAEKSDLFAV